MNGLGIYLEKYKVFFKSIIEWADLHYGFLMVILTAITAIVLILYTTSTWRMSKSTNRSVKVAEESIEITKEKERINRTLNLIEKFNVSKMDELWHKKYYHGQSGDKILGEVIPFLNYFDTVALLYLREKLDKDLFESKLREYFLTFSSTFNSEISHLLDPKKYLDSDAYRYYYYVEYLKKFMDKNLKRAKRLGLLSITK